MNFYQLMYSLLAIVMAISLAASTRAGERLLIGIAAFVLAVLLFIGAIGIYMLANEFPVASYLTNIGSVPLEKLLLLETGVASEKLFFLSYAFLLTALLLFGKWLVELANALFKRGQA